MPKTKKILTAKEIMEDSYQHGIAYGFRGLPDFRKFAKENSKRIIEIMNSYNLEPSLQPHEKTEVGMIEEISFIINTDTDKRKKWLADLKNNEIDIYKTFIYRMEIILEDESFLEMLEFLNPNNNSETPELKRIRRIHKSYKKRLKTLTSKKSSRIGYNKVLQFNLNKLFNFLERNNWNPSKCQNFVYDLYQAFAITGVSTVTPKENTQNSIKQFWYNYKKIEVK